MKFSNIMLSWKIVIISTFVFVLGFLGYSFSRKKEENTIVGKWTVFENGEPDSTELVIFDGYAIPVGGPAANLLNYELMVDGDKYILKLSDAYGDQGTSDAPYLRKFEFEFTEKDSAKITGFSSNGDRIDVLHGRRSNIEADEIILTLPKWLKEFLYSRAIFTYKEFLHDQDTLLRLVSSCDVNTLEWLEKNGGISVSKIRDKDGNSPLLLAAGPRDKYEVFQWLLRNGSEITEINKKGWGVMHYAAMGGNIRILQLAKTRGVNINSKAKNGYTPLDIADHSNKNEAVKWLLENEGKYNISRF